MTIPIHAQGEPDTCRGFLKQMKKEFIGEQDC